MEQWRSISETNGKYIISNYGRVKNKKLDRELKGTLDKDGYCKVGLRIKNKRIYRFVHRLVAIEFIPNIGNKPQVNHIDGNKSNNNVDNLEWVTTQENIIHAYQNGLKVGQCGNQNIETLIELDDNIYSFFSLKEASLFLGYGEKYLYQVLIKNKHKNPLIYTDKKGRKIKITKVS